MSAPKQVLFRDAAKAIEKINTLFCKLPEGRSAFQDLIELLLDPQRRVILYLGAGCSRQVEVNENRGDPPYSAPGWTELLEKILETFDLNRRRIFFAKLCRRMGAGYTSIRELFHDFDKLTVAWYLGSEFSSRSERDDAIAQVVEPPQGALRSSRLFDQLKYLPFRDVVTTNYDSNIQHCFRPEKMLREITCTKDLFAALDGKEEPGLFYLHGKAGRSELVLDRFDYAKLLAEPDGILQYVTFLLRNAHVIYIGFSLDDPTFNLMESRLHNSSDAAPYRPQSFAFLENITEREREIWRGRHLRIVDYGDHNILWELFECINKVRDFVRYAEPTRPPHSPARRNRTGAYLRNADEHYVNGEFARSLLDYRAALASTIFWDRDESGNYSPAVQGQLVCDILIRLAQSHYKLRWTRKTGNDTEDHSERMKGNLRDAIAILRRLRRAPDKDEDALLALRSSVNVLRSRVKYHDGQFSRARNIYSALIKHTKEHVSSHIYRKPCTVWTLRIAEAYYYSQCQISRIDYQVRPGEDWRQRQIAILREVGAQIERLCRSIAEDKTAFAAEAERHHYLNNLATILRIAKWTEGRLTISIFNDLLPTEGERSSENLKQLSEGIALLEIDPWDELRTNISSIADKGAKWEAPPRWLAMRYRYEARGRALRWMIGAATRGEQDASDLFASYAAIQRAMKQTADRDLHRQEMLNMLESTRLSIFSMLGERFSGQPPCGAVISNPFTRNVTLIHLNDAFNLIEKSGAPTKHRWHWLLAHRLASYFGLLAAPISKAELSQLNNSLQELLRLEADQMKERVINLYSQFASDSDERGHLSQRSMSYQETYQAIRQEIRESAFGIGSS
jgi:hypothetical protein